MKFGIHYSIGVNANPQAEDYIRVAQKAEECGYHSLWLGDHIVIPEKIEAAYPYSSDGAAGFPRRAPFPDPFVLLGGLALATSRILLGTSVIVIPYRNPLAVAKAVATVDLLSHGRFQFGVGVGWLKEEFDALGEDFARRARQTREYLHIMKAVWQAEPASFSGEFLTFSDIHTVPLPVQTPHPPIIFGGESLPALRRVADLGDGWQPGTASLKVLSKSVPQLQALMAERGRDYADLSVSALSAAGPLLRKPEVIPRLSELGVQELILFMTTADTNKTLAALEDFAEKMLG
jgi:probable F420-dependent oxidoreductase